MSEKYINDIMKEGSWIKRMPTVLVRFIFRYIYCLRMYNIIMEFFSISDYRINRFIRESCG
jgi:hypothetical protein